MLSAVVKSNTAQVSRLNTNEAVCEICGGRTVEKHCKIQCLNCGYTRDCSDP